MARIRGNSHAFGWPGLEPRWTHGHKDGVGTAYSAASRIWSTVWNGIVTEVYYPTVDTPQIRDVQLLFTDRQSFFHQETRYLETCIQRTPSFLGYRVEGKDPEGRYAYAKEIIRRSAFALSPPASDGPCESRVAVAFEDLCFVCPSRARDTPTGSWRRLIDVRMCPEMENLPMNNSKYAAFTALDPFFNIIQEGLAGLVDGNHYFETISEHAVFEFRYVFPGWPASISGRDALMALYAGYGDNIVLHKADALVVHHSQNPRVLILEYKVQGKAVRTGIPYHNRFVSIITDRALEGLHGLAGRHVCAQCLRMTSRRENNRNGSAFRGSFDARRMTFTTRRPA